MKTKTIRQGKTTNPFSPQKQKTAKIHPINKNRSKQNKTHTRTTNLSSTGGGGAPHPQVVHINKLQAPVWSKFPKIEFSKHKPFLNSTLYEKYSSTQNYHYVKLINDILLDGRASFTLYFKDYQQLDSASGTILEYITLDNYFSKLVKLAEYYKFHNEIPRIFCDSVYELYFEYHDLKRQANYEVVTNMLKIQKGEDPYRELKKELRRRRLARYTPILRGLPKMSNRNQTYLIGESSSSSRLESTLERIYENLRLISVSGSSTAYQNLSDISFEYSTNLSKGGSRGYAKLAGGRGRDAQGRKERISKKWLISEKERLESINQLRKQADFSKKRAQELTDSKRYHVGAQSQQKSQSKSTQRKMDFYSGKRDQGLDEDFGRLETLKKSQSKRVGKEKRSINLMEKFGLLDKRINEAKELLIRTPSKYKLESSHGGVNGLKGLRLEFGLTSSPVTIKKTNHEFRGDEKNNGYYTTKAGHQTHDMADRIKYFTEKHEKGKSKQKGKEGHNFEMKRTQSPHHTHTKSQKKKHGSSQTRGASNNKNKQKNQKFEKSNFTKTKGSPGSSSKGSKKVYSSPSSKKSYYSNLLNIGAWRVEDSSSKSRTVKPVKVNNYLSGNRRRSPKSRKKSALVKKSSLTGNSQAKQKQQIYSASKSRKHGSSLKADTRTQGSAMKSISAKKSPEKLTLGSKNELMSSTKKLPKGAKLAAGVRENRKKNPSKKRIHQLEKSLKSHSKSKKLTEKKHKKTKTDPQKGSKGITSKFGSSSSPLAFKTSPTFKKTAQLSSKKLLNSYKYSMASYSPQSNKKGSTLHHPSSSKKHHNTAQIENNKKHYNNYTEKKSLKKGGNGLSTGYHHKRVLSDVNLKTKNYDILFTTPSSGHKKSFGTLTNKRKRGSSSGGEFLSSTKKLKKSSQQGNSQHQVGLYSSKLSSPKKHKKRTFSIDAANKVSSAFSNSKTMWNRIVKERKKSGSCNLDTLLAKTKATPKRKNNKVVVVEKAAGVPTPENLNIYDENVRNYLKRNRAQVRSFSGSFFNLDTFEFKTTTTADILSSKLAGSRGGAGELSGGKKAKIFSSKNRLRGSTKKSGKKKTNDSSSTQKAEFLNLIKSRILENYDIGDQIVGANHHRGFENDHQQGGGGARIRKSGYLMNMEKFGFDIA